MKVGTGGGRGAGRGEYLDDFLVAESSLFPRVGYISDFLFSLRCFSPYKIITGYSDS